MAKHFDFDHYSIPKEEIDYKLFEDIPSEEIALYFANLIDKNCKNCKYNNGNYNASQEKL